jgi:hypothetical protein
MKNRHEFLRVLMLLSVLLIFSPEAYTQPPKDPERDLHISFSAGPEGQAFEFVFGSVRNGSANRYPCVLLTFNLATSSDQGTRRDGKARSQRPLGVVSVEVQGLPPRSVKRYEKRLPFPTGQIWLKSVSECSEQRDGQSVVIYENPNFEGRSRSFGIGKHRLFTAEDFNDLTSSIKVPEGLAVTVYEHADEGGGYGSWVDFLEDQPALSTYNFDNKISYLDVFNSQRPGFLYARNSIQNGGFVPGHWEGVRARGNPVNSNPVVGPPRPPNVVPSVPPVSNFCTISGQILRDKSEYRTIVGLYAPGDNEKRLFSTTVGRGGQYRFVRVPVGEYEVVPRGNYPSSKLDIGPSPRSRRVSCQPNSSHSADFTIQSNEG